MRERLAERARNTDRVEHHRRAAAVARAASTSIGGSTRGIDGVRRAHRERDRAPARREVADDDRLDADAAQLGDDREPDRARAEHDRRFGRRDVGTRDRVPADRHRLGQRGAAMIETVRHLHAHRRRSAASAPRSRRCRRWSTRRPASMPVAVSATGSDVTRSPDRDRRRLRSPAPSSSTSAVNSCPIT